MSKKTTRKDLIERGSDFVHRGGKRSGWDKVIKSTTDYVLNGFSRPKTAEAQLREINKLCINRCGIIADGKKVMFSINPNEETAVTDGKRVLVGTAVLDEHGKTFEEKADIMVGLTTHEMAHIKYSKFGTVKFKNKMHASIHNIIEDERIEHLLTEEFPGYAQNLADTKKFMLDERYLIQKALAEKSVGFSKMTEKEKAAMEVFDIFFKLVRYPVHIDEAVYAKHEKAVEEIQAVLTPYPMTCEEVDAASEKVYEVIRKTMKDTVNPPKPKPEKKEKQKKQKAEKNDCEDPGDEGEGNEGEGSDDEELDNEEKPGKGKNSKKSKKKEQSEDEDDDSEAEEEKEDGKEPKDDAEEKEDSGKEGESKDQEEQEDEKSEEESEEPKAKSKEKQDESEEEQEEEQEDEDEKEEEEPNKKGDSKSDESEDSDEEGEEESETEEEKADRELEEAKADLEAEKIVGEIEEAIGEMMEAFQSDNDPEKTEVEESKQTSKINFKEEYIHDPESNATFRPGEPDRDRYRSLAAGVNGDARRLASSLFTRVFNESKNLRGMRSGTLDDAKIIEAAHGIATVHTQHIEKETRSLNIVLLIDESGSMGWQGGPKVDNATKAAILIEKAFETFPAGQLFIYGFTSDYMGDHNRIFRYREPGLKVPFGLGDIKGRGNNRDGDCIRAVARRVRTFTQDPMLFFIISDGQPNAKDYWGFKDTRHAVTYVSKMKFFPIQIGIGDEISPEQQAEMFDEFIHYDTAKQMVDDLRKLILRKAHKIFGL
jgi:hypothetical protein